MPASLASPIRHLDRSPVRAMVKGWVEFFLSALDNTKQTHPHAAHKKFGFRLSYHVSLAFRWS